MAGVKVTIPFVNPKTGRTEMREGVDIGFTLTKPESFMEYELEDGTILRIRHTLQKVIRIENETDPSTGGPVYVMQAQGSMSIGKKSV